MAAPEPARRGGRRRVLLGLLVAAVVVPLLLSTIAFAVTRHAIEQDIADRSEIALAEAGVPGASVQVAGRDATVTVPGGPAAEERARTAVRGVTGVRTVVVRPRPSVPSTASPEPQAGVEQATTAPYSVSVRGQAVVVTAVVATEDERKALLSAAASRAHGRPVVDELRVQPGVRRPSTGAVVGLTDALAAGIGTASVEVTGRAATITGTVPSAAERSRLTAAARVALPDVSISDQLTVQAPSAPPPGEDQALTVRRTVVTFRPNSALVGGPGTAAVATVAAALRADPAARVRVTGHSASVGNPTAERQMGLARAAAVVDALVEAGVARDRLEISSVGATRPLTVDPAAVARNRRVEFAVIGGSS